jgi:hypothetical protein
MGAMMDRNWLIQCVENLKDKGGFAVELGKATLLADEDNLKIIITNWPELFPKSQPYLRIIK